MLEFEGLTEEELEGANVSGSVSPSVPDACGCLVFGMENVHTEAQHSDCGGMWHSLGPCGCCDSCISAQFSYYRLLELDDRNA